MTGGEGTRLRPLTRDIPKAMIPIAGKPFLEHQINLLKRNSITDIVLCVGYMGQAIRDYFRNGKRLGVSVGYSDDGDKPLGTAGALKNARHILADRFFLTFGDSFPVLDYRAAWNRFVASGKLALMVVHRNLDRYDPSNTVVERGLVTSYSKRRKTPEMTCIEFGVTFLQRSTLDLIRADFPVDLEDLYRPIIESGEMAALEVDQRVYEIGSPDGLEEFRKLAESGRIQL